MGQITFYNAVKRVDALSASQAFKNERDDALYMVGHGGGSGTIGEKDRFSMSRKPEDISADKWIDLLKYFDEGDRGQEHYSRLIKDFEIYDDKWGDALCIKTKDKYIFCGWANY
jgi:hypothetical protein